MTDHLPFQKFEDKIRNSILKKVDHDSLLSFLKADQKLRLHVLENGPFASNLDTICLDLALVDDPTVENMPDDIQEILNAYSTSFRVAFFRDYLGSLMIPTPIVTFKITQDVFEVQKTMVYNQDTDFTIIRPISHVLVGQFFELLNGVDHCRTIHFARAGWLQYPKVLTDLWSTSGFFPGLRAVESLLAEELYREDASRILPNLRPHVTTNFELGFNCQTLKMARQTEAEIVEDLKEFTKLLTNFFKGPVIKACKNLILKNDAEYYKDVFATKTTAAETVFLKIDHFVESSILWLIEKFGSKEKQGLVFLFEGIEEADIFRVLYEKLLHLGYKKIDGTTRKQEPHGALHYLEAKHVYSQFQKHALNFQEQSLSLGFSLQAVPSYWRLVEPCYFHADLWEYRFVRRKVNGIDQTVLITRDVEDNVLLFSKNRISNCDCHQRVNERLI